MRWRACSCEHDSNELYDAIGGAYPATRRTEPRIAALDAAELGLRLLVA